MNKWSMQVKNEYEKVRLRTALTRLGQWERTELHQANRELRQVRQDLDHLKAYRAVCQIHSFAKTDKENQHSHVKATDGKQDGDGVAKLSPRTLCLPGITTQGKLSPRTSLSSVSGESTSTATDGLASPRSSVSVESPRGVPQPTPSPAKSLLKAISALKLNNEDAEGGNKAMFRQKTKGLLAGSKDNLGSSTSAKRDGKKVSFDMFPKISLFTADSRLAGSPQESEDTTPGGAPDVKKPLSLKERFKAAAHRIIEDNRPEGPPSLASVVKQVIVRQREDLRSKLQDVPEPSAGKRLTSWAGLMSSTTSRWRQQVVKRKSRGTLEAYVPSFRSRYRRLPPREGQERSSVFPGNCKTTYALKNFMAKEMTDMLDSWSPSNRRILRSRKLKQTVPAIDFVDRTRTTSAILRDFRRFNEEKKKNNAKRKEGEEEEVDGEEGDLEEALNIDQESY